MVKKIKGWLRIKAVQVSIVTLFFGVMIMIGINQLVSDTKEFDQLEDVPDVISVQEMRLKEEIKELMENR